MALNWMKIRWFYDSMAVIFTYKLTWMLTSFLDIHPEQQQKNAGHFSFRNGKADFTINEKCKMLNEMLDARCSMLNEHGPTP